MQLGIDILTTPILLRPGKRYKILEAELQLMASYNALILASHAELPQGTIVSAIYETPEGKVTTELGVPVAPRVSHLIQTLAAEAGVPMRVPATIPVRRILKIGALDA